MAPPKKLKSLEGIKADKDFDWKAFGEEVALNPERAAFASRFGRKKDVPEGYDYFHGNWGKWFRDKNRWDPNRWRRHQNFFKAAWDLWKPPADVTDPDVEGPGSGGDDGGVDDGTPDTFTPEHDTGTVGGIDWMDPHAVMDYVDEVEAGLHPDIYTPPDTDIIGDDDGSTDPIDEDDPDHHNLGNDIYTPTYEATLLPEEQIRQFTATHMRQDPNINPYR